MIEALTLQSSHAGNRRGQIIDIGGDAS